MAKYKHIPTGTIVESAKELPSAVYAKLDEPKKAAPKRTAKKAASKE